MKPSQIEKKLRQIRAGSHDIVVMYAIELLGSVDLSTELTITNLSEVLLNGASDWQAYSDLRGGRVNDLVTAYAAIFVIVSGEGGQA